MGGRWSGGCGGRGWWGGRGGRQLAQEGVGVLRSREGLSTEDTNPLLRQLRGRTIGKGSCAAVLHI